MKETKNNDANNKPWLIILLGIIFFGGGIGCICGYCFSKTTIFIVVGCILLVLGLVILGYGIYRSIVLKKLKQLATDPSAYSTTAKFLDAKFSSYTATEKKASIGRAPIGVQETVNVFKKIIYEYTDENGVVRKVKSTKSYFPNQVEYLKQKGTFAIKCKGAISDIVEELPGGQSTIDFKL